MFLQFGEGSSFRPPPLQLSASSTDQPFGNPTASEEAGCSAAWIRPVRGETRSDPAQPLSHRYTSHEGPEIVPVIASSPGGAGNHRHADASIAQAAWAERVEQAVSAPDEPTRARLLFELVDTLLHDMVPLRGPCLIGDPNSPGLVRTNGWHDTPLDPEARQRLFARYGDALRVATAIDATQLEPDAADHLEALTLLLSQRLALTGHLEYLYPASHMVDSWPVHLLRVIENQTGLPFSSQEDVALFLHVLRSWKIWLHHAEHNMREGMRQGVTAPRAVNAELLRTLERADCLRRSRLYETASQRIRALELPADVAHALDAQYWQVVEDDLIPGYQALYDFLRNEYGPKTRPSSGLHGVPRGIAHYGDMARLLTFSTYGLDELRAMLAQQEASANAAIDAIQREMGISSSRADFMFYMKQRLDEPRFATPDEVLDCMERTAQQVLMHAEAIVPVAGPLVVNVRGIPAEQPGQYLEPVGASNVSTMLVPVDYSNAGLYSPTGLAVLATHEIIGHGLFLLWQRQHASQPAFAHRVAVAGPREGFASYVERWIERLDFIGPAYRYEAVHTRLRMVVWADLSLRLHLGEIDLRQSIVEYQDRTVADAEVATKDMVRAAAWPGQEHAFWLNAAVIDGLLEEAQIRQGDAFDLREFHRVVMGAGERPPHMIQRRVRAWLSAS